MVVDQVPTSLTVLVLLQTAFEQIYLQESDWGPQTLKSSEVRNSNSTLSKVLFRYLFEYKSQGKSTPN